MFNINCKGKLIILDRPFIMGILNLTLDSFYDGGRYLTLQSQLDKVNNMIEEGVDIIDIGASSSRPGAILLPPDNEWTVIEPLLNEIKFQFPDLLISIDTVYSSVAEYSLQKGAHIINDISGGMMDKKIFEVCAYNQAPLILMHMPTTPDTMQSYTNYHNVTTDVYAFFSQQLSLCMQLGVHDVFIDVGFGFGKTLEQNYQLIRDLEYFHQLNRPILVGVSRKSMIQKVVSQDADNSLIGTCVLQYELLAKGAHIFRVHDVRAMKDTISIWQQVRNTAFDDNTIM